MQFRSSRPLHLLPAYRIVQRAKQDVGYDDPIYKTGILIPREALERLKSLMGKRYEVKTDADLAALVAREGQDLISEIMAVAEEEK